MSPVDGRSFWQYWLIRSVMKDPEGVCFRESFKWLACRTYDRPFKTGTLTGPEHDRLALDWQEKFAQTGLEKDKARSNPAKVLKKQGEYLGRVHPYEGKGASFSGFSVAVNQISLDTLRGWGKKAAEGGAMKYNLSFRSERVDRLIGHAAFRNPSAAMVVGVYGMSSDGPWAHAVAFHHDVLFDPNGGEFSFDATDDRGAEIQEHCERNYTGDDGNVSYDIRNYVLYPATRH